jgi:hypothetical protein
MADIIVAVLTSSPIGFCAAISLGVLAYTYGGQFAGIVAAIVAFVLGAWLDRQIFWKKKKPPPAT